AEPQRVEEVDALEVHDEPAPPARDELDEAVAQLRGGGQVDVAVHSHDRPRITLLGGAAQLHVAQPTGPSRPHRDARTTAVELQRCHPGGAGPTIGAPWPCTPLTCRRSPERPP